MSPAPPTHRLSSTSNDPQWFAFVEESHSGPFSTIDIQLKLMDESLRAEDYVWTSGMEDWLPISKLELFYPDAPVVPTVPEIETPKPSHPIIREKKIYVDRPVGSTVIPPRRNLVGRFTFLLLGLFAITAILLLYRPQPFPFLPDISTADERLLAHTGGISLGKYPLSAAVALSQNNPGAPSFYVASNAPDGSLLQLRIAGKTDTLLSFTPFRTEQRITIQKHYGRSLPLLRKNGRALARGWYKVSVTDLKGILLTERDYFLGGFEDADYRRALNTIHENLPKQKRAELTELHQVISALDDQLTQTSDQFQALAYAPTRWRAFSHQWNLFEKQLSEELRATPSDEEDVYYLAQFIHARAVLEKISEIHRKQNLLVITQKQTESAEMVFIEETKTVQKALSLLKNELVAAEAGKL